MYQGETIHVSQLDEGFVELCFDRRNAAINKFDKLTVNELREAVKIIANAPTVRGVLVSSAKEVFIVGADINEFGTMFKMSPADLTGDVMRSNEVFNAFEDLQVPSVAAINGLALGGGMEMTLTCALRVMSTAAQVGLPEVMLGLIPGFGGTVRMSRVAGPAAAVAWIASGKPHKAAAALETRVIDEICAPDALHETALACLRKAANGEIDWSARQDCKRKQVALSADQLRAVFEKVVPGVVANSARHQPAVLIAAKMMERAASEDRTGALKLEANAFAQVAKTQAASSLVQTFHNEQALKKLFRQHARSARPLRQGAVLGAGIMGGGIAYTSALHGTPVLMKDISTKQLDLGVSEVAKLLARQVKGGRVTQDRANQVQGSIKAQLDYSDFDQVDLVVEAVVENLQVKHVVLSELEDVVRDDAIIASNTSSLRIDDIGQALKRPENFVGMHFFNPVPVMALVEVIKGSKTSDVAVSTAVGYAVAMGKTPIVVKDCPGFLVNRILTAYIRAFLQLVADGADFAQIDRVMEAFGWPMGPAYLEDVIGLDTGSHVNDVISAGYADRMPALQDDALRLMARSKRYGQKNGIGFYRYENDLNGKLKKLPTVDTYDLLTSLQPAGLREFTEQEIIDRMMLPVLVESAHALEDGVVATPAELDMALQLGIGFPKYLGGPLKYADWLGLDQVIRLSDKHAHLGHQYLATAAMRDMAAKGLVYYGG